MAENSTFLLHNAGLGFGDYGPADELLHPEMNAEITDAGLTETQYFGFSVPEEKIHGLGYFWHHPNLGVLSGCIAAWRGFKEHQLSAELYDMRMFMSDKVIQGNIDNYTLENGYRVQVIEPFQKMRIAYSSGNGGENGGEQRAAAECPGGVANVLTEQVEHGVASREVACGSYGTLPARVS